MIVYLYVLLTITCTYKYYIVYYSSITFPPSFLPLFLSSSFTFLPFFLPSFLLSFFLATSHPFFLAVLLSLYFVRYNQFTANTLFSLLSPTCYNLFLELYSVYKPYSNSLSTISTLTSIQQHQTFAGMHLT